MAGRPPSDCFPFGCSTQVERAGTEHSSPLKMTVQCTAGHYKSNVHLGHILLAKGSAVRTNQIIVQKSRAPKWCNNDKCK
jgi:hypothetical protein